jgi:hypothetical protein
MQEQDWGDEELWIVVASDLQDLQSGKKGVPFSPANPRSGATVSGEELKESRVKAETLAAQMSQFVRVIGRVFADAQKQIDPQAGLQLDEIKLAVDISAKGEIKLLGTGIETSGKGAIELKFKRAELPKKSQPSESV